MTTILNVAAALVATILAVGILMPSAPGWKSVRGAVVNAMAAASILYLAMFALFNVGAPS